MSYVQCNIKCPKCGQMMQFKDKDSEYTGYNNQKFMTKQTLWYRCKACNCSAIKETVTTYTDSQGYPMKSDDEVGK